VKEQEVHARHLTSIVPAALAAIGIAVRRIEARRTGCVRRVSLPKRLRVSERNHSWYEPLLPHLINLSLEVGDVFFGKVGEATLP